MPTISLLKFLNLMIEGQRLVHQATVFWSALQAWVLATATHRQTITSEMLARRKTCTHFCKDSTTSILNCDRTNYSSLESPTAVRCLSTRILGPLRIACILMRHLARLLG